jgi:hypothetical protein
MPIHFYWNWSFEINPTDSIFLASNIQVFIVVYLHINSNISTDVKYLWLLLSSCSLSYYSSSACLEVLQSHVWAISSSFYFGHKNRLKLQFDQSLSITSLVILLRIRSIRLDWSPSLPGSFAVLRVVALRTVLDGGAGHGSQASVGRDGSGSPHSRSTVYPRRWK